MSEEDKLNDFNYLFDCISSSVPVDTLDELNNLYNIDFVGRHDTYIDMIKATEVKRKKEYARNEAGTAYIKE